MSKCPYCGDNYNNSVNKINIHGFNCPFCKNALNLEDVDANADNSVDFTCNIKATLYYIPIK